MLTDDDRWRGAVLLDEVLAPPEAVAAAEQANAYEPGATPHPAPRLRPNVPRPPAPSSRRDVAAWLAWMAAAFASHPQRFRHAHTVWQRARAVIELPNGWMTRAEADALELAALLHDIGRALDPDDHDLHGFVGAALLDEVGLRDVAPLAAHHSGGRFEAEIRGVSHLDAWESDPRLLDVLTYLDRTTSPTGEVVTLGQRRAELVTRFGEESVHVRVHDLSLASAWRGRSLAVTPRRTVAALETRLPPGAARTTAHRPRRVTVFPR